MHTAAFHRSVIGVVLFAFTACSYVADPIERPRLDARGHVVRSEGGPDDKRITPHIIPPQATDREISVALEPHYVWPTPSGRKHSNSLLYVLLPGTTGTPDRFQLLGAEAARQGYHVITLMYPTSRAVGAAICNPLPDREQRERCYLDTRLQGLDGMKRSGFTDVDPPNSIYNRLVKLLEYLDDEYPDEEWGQFLKDEEPQWSRIVVAGFSEGGGYAALIAKLHRVARVVLFSSPLDGLGVQPARWIAIGETPSELYYALGHAREPSIGRGRAAWLALGLDRFGEVVLQDGREPPYDGTHMLITDLAPATGTFLHAHPSTAVDGFTPLRADGIPALRDVWAYLNSHAIGVGFDE
ncbi:MAG: hypothetical protein NVS1B4_12260 [Gemmatimonadaceae bacterium]